MKNPSIIIIGPGKTFGVHIAEKFGRYGFDIILAGRAPETLRQQADALSLKGITAEYIHIDVSDPHSVDAVFDSLERGGKVIELLIYNAVARRVGSPSELTVEDIYADFGINVCGGVSCFNRIIKMYKKQGYGAVIFTGGGVALNPSPVSASMSLGKAALRNYALNLAYEFHGTGIFIGTVTITEPVAEGKNLTPERTSDAFYRMFAEKREHEIIL
ncbi:MAG: SDR family oxidoreductase [Rikenellaceae bacterium]|nr:SDR family oxidoreductase [Rikenellaceae bacterium]